MVNLQCFPTWISCFDLVAELDFSFLFPSFRHLGSPTFLLGVDDQPLPRKNHLAYLLWLTSASPLLLFFPGPQLCRRKGDNGLKFCRPEEGGDTSMTLSSNSSSSPEIIAMPSWPSPFVPMLKQLPSGLYLSLDPRRPEVRGTERLLPMEEFLSSDMVSSTEEVELLPADCSSSGCFGIAIIQE